jgi:hypothetical protein
MSHERPNSVYGLYLRRSRQLGHYRWFSVFMKHVGSRVDRALIHWTIRSMWRASLPRPAS